jgi:DNA-binding MarR family transcriptional regulator
MKSTKIFGALRKMREFERLQLPFIGSLTDFDIVIEIGEAQERNQVLTPKQLFLLKVGAVSTVRRRLAELTRAGIVRRKTNAKDRRSGFLTIAPATIRQLEKYSVLLSGLSS